MDLFQKCKELYEKIRYFEYGIPVDGVIKPVPSPEYFAKNYHFLKPEEFEKYGGGVCWDYVEYERKCLEVNDIDFNQYYLITNTPPNYDTHTFITVKDGDELIYIESSFKRVEHIIDGVQKFKTLEDIVRLITTNMWYCNNNDKHFDEFKYDVCKFKGHPQYGCTCQEYMDWMDNNSDIVIQDVSINPKKVNEDELAVEEFVVNKVDTKFTQFVCESANDPEEYDETLHDHIDDEDDIYNETSVLKFPKKVNNVPFDIMYFGSNIDFGNESIKLDHNELFLTPYIGLASIFITDRKEYFKPLPKDRPAITNIGYDEWGLSPSELQKPLKEVHVSLDDIPNVTPFEFDYTGYIYAIDVSQYKNNLYQKDWMTSDREFILKDINPVPIKEKIKWTHHVYVRGGKNTDDVYNESAQETETVQKGRNLADPDGVIPGSEKSKEELEQELAKYIKTINESWTDFKNGVHPSSGLMFHVSLKNDMDGKTINPQLPSYITDGGELDDNYQEDTKTKRLCVSPSIEGCLIAILNYNKIREHVGDKFYVYTPEKPFSQYKHKTNKEIVKDKLVFDANITKEAWILEPCKLKLYGIIKLKKVKDLKKKPTVEKNIKMNTIKLDYEWIMTPKASGKFNKAIGDSPDKEDTKEKPIKEYDNILVSNEEFFGLSMIQESHKNITKHSFKSLTKKGIAVDNNSETGKLVKKVIDNVLKNHSLPSIKLNPSGFGVAKETDTFFYGYPRYIDGEIPTSKGKQLRFMAQINCKELKSLPDYPHTGLLQFWVHGDSEILDGPVKVIYIEKPNKNNIANVSLDEALYSYDDPGDFPRIDIKGYNHSDNLLFKSTTKETIGPNITDLEVLYKIFSEEYKKLTGKKADISALDDYIWDDDRLQPSWGNRVGGYPSSTQETSSKRTKSWNTMLLQLESIDREVYWGDFGIAAFYISHDDLIKRDFSKVGFDWDCY